MRIRAFAWIFLCLIMISTVAWADTPDTNSAPANPPAATQAAPAAAPTTVIVNNPAPAAPAPAAQTPVVNETKSTTTFVEHPAEGAHGMGMMWIVGGAVILVALVALVGIASNRQ